MAQKLGLTKQYASIPLSGGLDLKTDPKQVAAPNLLKADNVMYVTSQMLRKRYGWTAPGSPSLASGESGIGLLSSNSQLLYQSTEALYALENGDTTWRAKTAPKPVSVSTQNLFSSQSFQADQTSTTGIGVYPPTAVSVLDVPSTRYRAVCSHGTGTAGPGFPLGGIAIGIVDKVTGDWIYGPQTLGTAVDLVSGIDSWANPTWVYDGTNNYLYLMCFQYNESIYTQLAYWAFPVSALPIINVSNATYGPQHVAGSADPVFGATNAFIPINSTLQTFSAVFPSTPFAATFFNGNLYIAVGTASASTVYKLYTTTCGANGALTVSATTNGSSPQTGQAHTRLSMASNNTYMVVGSSGGTVDIFNTSLTKIAVTTGAVQTTTFDVGSSEYYGDWAPVAVGIDNFNNVSFVGNTDTKVQGIFYASQVFRLWSVSGVTATSIYNTTWRPPGALNFVAPVSATIHEVEGFSHPSVYWWTVAGPQVGLNTQGCTFLVRAQGGTGTPSVIGRFFLDSTVLGDYPSCGLLPPATNGTVGLYKSTATAPNGTQLLGVAMAVGLNNFPSYVKGKQLDYGNFLAGSAPYFYDHQQTVEAGFSTVPMLWKLTTNTSPTPGLTQSAKYSYILIYTWLDNLGRKHRSAPSAAFTITSASNPGAYAGNQFYVQEYYRGYTEVYRTAANGSVFYFLVTLGGLGNQLDIYGDITPDSSITGNATLYTASNELQSDPCPPLSYVAVSKTRLFGIFAENPAILYYTKSFVLNSPPEWNLLQFIEVDPITGPLTAVATLDDNVICFKSGAIYAFSGTGPDNTGNGAFTEVVRLPTDCGCTDPNSVLSTAQGIYFKGARGICRLNRSLVLEYVGLPVDTQTSTVVGTQLNALLQQVRFATGGSWLVYDYLHNAWSTYSALGALDTETWIGTNYCLLTNQTVRQEGTGFLDNVSTPITMTVQTPWLKTAGLQGWGRTYRAALLGDYKSASSLNVTLNYDYSTSYSDSLVFNTSTGLINGDSVFQFRMSRLPRQVMQAVTFTFVDSGTTGESYDISNLTLEYGQKAGLAKLPGQKTL